MPSKFQSSWDLTPNEIAKNEKKLKKKHKRPSAKITKGFLELMNLADPLMTKEQTTIGEPTLKNLAASAEPLSRTESLEGDKNNNKNRLDNQGVVLSQKMIRDSTNKRGMFIFHMQKCIDNRKGMVL